MTTSSRKVSIAVHGGAGAVARTSITPDEEHQYHHALERALAAGHDVLARGGTSLQAVTEAVVILEDCPLFNSARGSVLDYAGQVLTDAAVMAGHDLASGAVTNVQGVKNPVKLANEVMKSPHVFLSAAGARDFAESRGIEIAPPEYFITEARHDEWLAARGNLTPPLHTPPGVGTVGAVALDAAGNVAAATSTGGMVLKRWGRIGDSPVIGAGTYADNRSAAVSATGHGEMFLRVVAAHDVCARVRYLGQSLETASREVLAEVARLGGTGGLIALSPQGDVVMEFNSDGMYRGSIGTDGHLRTRIWE